MNVAYAKILVFVFFLGVGTFNIVRGVVSVRSRSESTLAGWVRIALGTLMVLMPFPLLYLLRQ